MAAMCGILTLIGQQGGASDEDLKKLLVSAGLQEDRVHLLLAQVCASHSDADQLTFSYHQALIFIFVSY